MVRRMRGKMRIISPLPMDKVDLIRSQVGVDWSKEIVEGATFEDLDPEAYNGSVVKTKI